MKEKIIKFTFWTTISLMLFLAGCAVLSTKNATRSCYEQYTEILKIEACNKDLSDSKLADYTLLLAGATLLLAIIATLQLYLLLSADETARLTAQAALDANRPWLDLDPQFEGPLEHIPLSCNRHARSSLRSRLR